MRANTLVLRHAGVYLCAFIKGAPEHQRCPAFIHRLWKVVYANHPFRPAGRG